ncbi:tetratricopeptide repeat protein [Streptomyces sp. NPDC058394]|uniref:tetratricopeptide repeat protein n=1 Tax=Streptomyces sp. NPDC058394 TaxID=3346477 RepID=UPI0036668D22
MADRGLFGGHRGTGAGPGHLPRHRRPERPGPRPQLLGSCADRDWGPSRRHRGAGGSSGQANALNHMGAVQIATGNYTSAAVLLEQVLDTYRYIGDRAGEAEVLNRVGTLRLKCGDPRQAQAHHLRALELARTIRNQLEEARALEGDARCCELTSNYPAALSRLREAVSVYQRIGAAEAPAAARYLAQLEAERPEEGSVQDSTV